MVEQQALALDEPYMTGTERRFWQFHEANRWVYDELATMARTLRDRGYDRFSIRDLWGVIRWTAAATIASDETFAFNNSYTAYYARLIMEKEPDLAGFFETRKSKADG